MRTILPISIEPLTAESLARIRMWAWDSTRRPDGRFRTDRERQADALAAERYVLTGSFEDRDAVVTAAQEHALRFIEANSRETGRQA